MSIFSSLFKKKSSGVNEITFRIPGLTYHKNAVESIMTNDKRFYLSDRDFMDKIAEGKSIYAYLYYSNACDLKHEPTNKHNRNAVMVIADGKKIGYVPDDMCQSIGQMIRKKHEASVEIHGGPRRWWENGNVFIDSRNLVADVKLKML